jgi:glycine cleavage system H protein
MIVEYKRCRFSMRLPADRLYTPSHFWLSEIEPGLWRVGFTPFATRMLGDLVEHGFSSRPGDSVALGLVIGWVEGFKAISDICCVGNGAFVGGNSALDKDVTLVDTDHYGAGWLYGIRGTPDPQATDVHGYVALLDLTIDKMQGRSGGRVVDTPGGETGCAD